MFRQMNLFERKNRIEKLEMFKKKHVNFNFFNVLDDGDDGLLV